MMRDGHGRLLADRYQLGPQLGTGGMAAVHLAHDRVLDRPVAVKLLTPPAAADPDAVARFDREARAAATLTHPNVVTMFDHGTDTTTGAHFLVMEYVAGSTLAETLARQGPLPPAAAARIGWQVCQALEAAHGVGLVHRDIKPANILLGAGGLVKVADFGIATATPAARSVDGAPVWGTPAYLSPEQARGKRVDARSDVYALGCVLYELLTGSPPFSGDAASLAWQHAAWVPEPPSVRAPQAGQALDGVVMTALAKQPEERYPTAEAMAGALAEMLAETLANATALVDAATTTPAVAAAGVSAADRPTAPLPPATGAPATGAPAGSNGAASNGAAQPQPQPGAARRRPGRPGRGLGSPPAWAWWLLLGLLGTAGAVVVALLLRVDSPQGSATAAGPSRPPVATQAPTTSVPSTSSTTPPSTTTSTTSAPAAGAAQTALAGLAEALAAGQRAGTVDQSASDLLRNAQDLVRAAQDRDDRGQGEGEGEGEGEEIAKKVAELARKTDELIREGKIVQPSATQVRQAVAQLGAALTAAG